MEPTTPFFIQPRAITYPTRPKHHCVACWQSKRAGNPWDHRKCAAALREYIENLSNYSLPQAKINLKIMNAK